LNILILNIHSALNLGDDGIMYETLKALRSEYPGATITIAANIPDSWRKYDGVHIVGSITTWVVSRKNDEWHWRKAMLLPYIGFLMFTAMLYRLFHLRLLFGHSEQRKLLRAYYDADLVLSCGGGNFYAHQPTSPSFVWSLLTLTFAHWLGKRIVLLPQSIGPIEGIFQRFLARFVFNRVTRILLREYYSLLLLKKLKVNVPVFVLPDLAFGSSLISSDDHILTVQSDGAVHIGVTVIDRAAQKKGFINQQIYEDALVSLLVRLNREYAVHIYFFVQCYGPTRDQDDRYSTRRVYDRVRQQTADVSLLDSFKSAAEIRTAYKYMDCVIGSRMHTGVFALSVAVPVVLVAYQPKAFGIMQMFELEQYCCSIEQVTEKELSKLVYEVLDNRQELSLHIAQHLALVQKQLLGWVRHLEEN